MIYLSHGACFCIDTKLPATCTARQQFGDLPQENSDFSHILTNIKTIGCKAPHTETPIHKAYLSYSHKLTSYLKKKDPSITETPLEIKLLQILHSNKWMLKMLAGHPGDAFSLQAFLQGLETKTHGFAPIAFLHFTPAIGKLYPHLLLHWCLSHVSHHILQETQ